MKDTPTLIEYGAPIDPQAMVKPLDATELELEPGHPGLGDAEYIRRRKELFAICRKHRLEKLGPPLIQYNAEETRIWRRRRRLWRALPLAQAGRRVAGALLGGVVAMSAPFPHARVEQRNREDAQKHFRHDVLPGQRRWPGIARSDGYESRPEWPGRLWKLSFNRSTI